MNLPFGITNQGPQSLMGGNRMPDMQRHMGQPPASPHPGMAFNPAGQRFGQMMMHPQQHMPQQMPPQAMPPQAMPPQAMPPAMQQALPLAMQQVPPMPQGWQSPYAALMGPVANRFANIAYR